jgi:heptosyltransferase-2
LAGATYVDDLLPDPGPSLAGTFALTAELRRRRFDLAIIYPRSFRAALAPLLAGIPERIGHRGELRRWLLTRALGERPRPRRLGHPGPRQFPYPMSERYRELVVAAGGSPGDGRPVLAVSPECEERARKKRAELGIADGERLIGINPGASFGASKLWPVERFARLIDLLNRRFGRRAIIFVGPGEEEIARRIQEGSASRSISTGGGPLGLDLLKPFVRDLDLLVTTDTGTRHYAVAFRVPVVVIMGPTHPGFTAANLDETEVIRRDVPCGPCHLKVCPLDHRCMTLIEPEEVLERAEALLARTGRAMG